MIYRPMVVTQASCSKVGGKVLPKQKASRQGFDTMGIDARGINHLASSTASVCCDATTVPAAPKIASSYRVCTHKQLPKLKLQLAANLEHPRKWTYTQSACQHLSISCSSMHRVYSFLHSSWTWCCSRFQALACSRTCRQIAQPFTIKVQWSSP